MSENEEVVKQESPAQPQPPKRRFGIFFPLLLIIIGVFFLLYNMGVVSGDIWSLIWQFWPVLLIVGGLDSIFRREGLVGAVFFIGVGVILLLANLGYLNVSVWQLILTLWPVALIAIGFDILFGRRSLWLSLVGVVLVLVILVGALGLMGVAPQQASAITGSQISQGLEGAIRANVSIEPGAGELIVGGISEAEMLVAGTVPEGQVDSIETSYSVSSGVGNYILKGNEGSFVIPSTNISRWTWNLGLNDQIPLVLLLDLGAGDMQADLRSLSIESFQTNMGVGHGLITLPMQGNLDGKLSGGVGQLEILVPGGMEVLIRADTGIAAVDIPEGYVRTGDMIKSPGYDEAENRATLDIDMGIGMVNIRETP
jgi:hypothetical protein